MSDDTKMEGISHPITLENEEQEGSKPEPEEVKKDVEEEEKVEEVKPESVNSQEAEKFLTEAQQNGGVSPSPESSMWKSHRARM